MLAGVQPFTAHIADAVDQYCQAHSNQLPTLFVEQKKWTAENYEFPERMSSSLQAQLFIFMASDRRARRVLDVGAFSGYSALAWKEGMRNVDGEVWTLENDPLMITACKATFERYDPEGRIHLEPGPAIETLKRIEGEFDIIYLDAHKGEYIEYLNIILDRGLLARTGIIMADDAICRGLVADSSDKNENASDKWRVPNLLRAARVHAFNESVIKDSRVDVLLLPAFDGLSMIKLRQ